MGAETNDSDASKEQASGLRSFFEDLLMAHRVHILVYKMNEVRIRVLLSLALSLSYLSNKNLEKLAVNTCYKNTVGIGI